MRAIVVAFALVMTAAPAAADTVRGSFRCNATDIPIRATVSVWDTAKRELRVMLFKATPPAEAVKFWIDGGHGGYPTEWGYAAKFTFTFKDESPKASHASVRDYTLYVDCPTLQANLSGGGITPRGRDKLRQGFPTFEAVLSPGGAMRMAARGADKLELPTPTSVSWDVSVEATIAVK